MGITWSVSGDEVTFISQDLRVAYAHHVVSGATRQLYASDVPGEQVFDAALAADGAEWFTTSTGASGRVIRRHTSAGATVLTDRGRGMAPSDFAEGSTVLVAPAQPAAAFVVMPDSLYLLRRGADPRILGTGCGGVVAFSPDESRLLCSAGGWPRSFRVFRTDGGAAESLALPDHVAGAASAIRWGAQGIQVVYTGSSDGDRYHRPGQRVFAATHAGLQVPGIQADGIVVE